MEVQDVEEASITNDNELIVKKDGKNPFYFDYEGVRVENPKYSKIYFICNICRKLVYFCWISFILLFDSILLFLSSCRNELCTVGR